MAEYFANPQDAEDYIRRASRPTVLYARIQLHGAEKWMVDHDRRALGSSIKILEDLTGTVNRIKSSEAKMSAKATPLEDLRSCPSCGKSDSPYDAGAGLNLFRCSCGKVYCDACSGGGRITLPRCPVSPYHEDLQKVGTLPAAKPTEAASPTGATTPRPVSSSSPEPPTSPLPKDATIRTIMVFKSGAEALNEIVYLQQVIESIGLSLTALEGAHLDNIYYVTPDKLDATYIAGFVAAAGHDVSQCTLTPFTDRDGGAGIVVKVFGQSGASTLPARPTSAPAPPSAKSTPESPPAIASAASRSKLPDEIDCPKCGKTVKKHDYVCAYCGNTQWPSAAKLKSSGNSSAERWTLKSNGVIIVALIAIGFSVYWFWFQQQGKQSDLLPIPSAETKSADVPSVSAPQVSSPPGSTGGQEAQVKEVDDIPPLPSPENKSEAETTDAANSGFGHFKIVSALRAETWVDRLDIGLGPRGEYSPPDPKDVVLWISVDPTPVGWRDPKVPLYVEAVGRRCDYLTRSVSMYSSVGKPPPDYAVFVVPRDALEMALVLGNYPPKSFRIDQRILNDIRPVNPMKR